MRNPSKSDSDRMLVAEAAQGTLPLMMQMWGMGCRRVPMRGMGQICHSVGGTMLPIGTPVAGGRCGPRGVGLRRHQPAPSIARELRRRIRGRRPRHTRGCKGCVPLCNWPEEYCKCGTCEACPGDDCGKYGSKVR